MIDRLLPRSPRGRILHAVGVLTAGYGLTNYLLVEPNPEKQWTIAWALGLIPYPSVWGAIMITLGLNAAIASYRPGRWKRLSLAVLMAFTGMWALGIIGSVVVQAGFELTALAPWVTWTGLTWLLHLAGDMEGEE